MQPLAAPGPPTTTFATSSTIDKPSSFYFYFYQYFYLYCHYWQPLLGRSCPETFLHQIPVAALFYQLMTICFFSLLRHKSQNELIVLEDHACPWKVLIERWQNHGWWLYQANWALLQAYDRQICGDVTQCILPISLHQQNIAKRCINALYFQYTACLY